MGLFKALFTYKSIKCVAEKIDEIVSRYQCNKRLETDNDNTIKVVVRHEYVDTSADDKTSRKKSKK